jgi:hypothetical protein
MPSTTDEPTYTFDRPGMYCIRVHGTIDASWSERLAGMHITTRNRGGAGPVTTLAGMVPDQAALAGVLETLYEGHFTLLSVEML